MKIPVTINIEKEIDRSDIIYSQMENGELAFVGSDGCKMIINVEKLARRGFSLIEIKKITWDMVGRRLYEIQPKLNLKKTLDTLEKKSGIDYKEALKGLEELNK